MNQKLNVLLSLFLVMIFQFSYSQERIVSGTVLDKAGLPLPGVSVLVKGTQLGTQTDFDGKFKIKASASQILVFSFIGMKTQEKPANSTSISVTLVDDAVELEGVVVTALGIKRKPKDLGYSVSTIKPAEITENSEPDLLRAINGKVAGVNINVSSGVAGAANQITIRGINSFTKDTQPLIIVDGVKYNNTSVATSNQTNSGGGYESALSSLDPNNIASINILKSAAASALYGSRAVNGVIVITTKTGSTNAPKNNKLSVNVSSGAYSDNIANLPDYQNKYGAGSNFKYGPSSNGSWGPAFGKSGSLYNLNDDGTIPTWPTVLEIMPELGPTVPYVAKPNNVKDLFRTGTVYDNSIGFNYAGQDGNFNSTISNLNQNGYIPYNSYDRTSVAMGGNFKLANKLTVGANMSYAKTSQNGGFFGDQQSSDESSSSAFARTLFIARNWDLNLPYENPLTGASVTPNGNQFDHPLWSLKHDRIISKTNRTVAGINLDYSINKNISASYRFGFNRYTLDRKEIRDKNSIAYGGVGYLVSDNFTNEDIESTLLVNFNYKLNDDINLTAIAGNNILQTNTSRIAFAGREIITPNLFTLRNFKNISSLVDEGTRYRNVGLFADVTLAYKNYLFLNATGRNDYSSSLPVNNNSYFYPSVNTSLIVTDAFNIESDILTFAKLRASYAKVGNDAPAEFLSSSFILGDAFNGNPVIGNSTALADQQIKPEFTNEYEIGTELEFYNRRIALDLSLYTKTTTDLITAITTPTSTGYDTYNTNIGKMNNKGIEVALTLVPVKNTNFNWTSTTTFTKNKNKVIEIAEGIERTEISASNGGAKTEGGLSQVGYIIKGQPYGIFYGTKFAKDNSGNYLIDPGSGGILADTEAGIIGNPNADFKMSFTNTFSYKGFSLRAQFDWKQGGDFKSSTLEQLMGRGVTKDTEDREHTYIIPGYYGQIDANSGKVVPITDTNNNPVANTTQITANDLYFSPSTNGNTFAINSVDEATVYDGTVFRLREISLTYDLPSKILKKTAFGKVSFSVLGTNLWYFAPNVPKYTNFDPEIASFGSGKLQGIEITAAPTSKRLGFKINLTF
ncbi:TonB-linked outer membrane protein, SusC/RagA family [Flavobacterium glycines]|uniref:SusC/RagA family TonB-linked outer membrane protein n=1 Tax=Flavobacterium glycines TaxID=551990 RepID=A0A1B9DHI3_9FLAO|nr:SusC/RagA family TonB-linked outer membrane protein [Flavobacterium glycines]OCB69138.1 SusC/RagA family TonB-linked outer membrane protein [Flavobacterium glycines]GEL11932.1 SusC/RagA family TonB-linked outer membrane protein [Flavobacterium glycines]SDJ56318.1 TonB-linked outer membrane protein, SusC/RagA family [Flavobacterium glycines]